MGILVRDCGYPSLGLVQLAFACTVMLVGVWRRSLFGRVLLSSWVPLTKSRLDAVCVGSIDARSICPPAKHYFATIFLGRSYQKSNMVESGTSHVANNW